MLPERPRLTDTERSGVASQLEVYLERQVFSMPSYMLVAYLLALFVFEFVPVVRHGRAFSRLSPALRRDIIDSWSNSAIGPKRDLLKLIRNCALYFYLDHAVVRSHLEREGNPDGV